MKKTFFAGIILATLAISCEQTEQKANLQAKAEPGGLEKTGDEISTQLVTSETNPAASGNKNEGDVERHYDVSTDRGNGENSTQTIQPQLIKQGRITYETESIAVTRKRLDSLMHRYGAYANSDREETSHDRQTVYLTVRIPAKSFDPFLTGLTSGVSYFDEKTITVSDVSEEYLDLQARLKSKQEMESKLYELLRKSGKMSEILEIHDRIASLRGEIESIQGRIKYLSNQVSYSTLDISIYQKIEQERPISENRFVKALKGGWEGFLGFVTVIFYLWPFILFGLLLIILFIIRRRKRNLNS